MAVVIHPYLGEQAILSLELPSCLDPGQRGAGGTDHIQLLMKQAVASNLGQHLFHLHISSSNGLSTCHASGNLLNPACTKTRLPHQDEGNMIRRKIRRDLHEK